MPTTPPPDVPSGVPQPIADYLRRLQVWAYQELDKAVKKDEATTKILLAAYDKKTNPGVYSLGVNSAGTVTATAVPYGEGKP